jgi:signal transduction histidine kinase
VSTALAVPLHRAADAVVGEAFRIDLPRLDDVSPVAVPEQTLDAVLSVLFQNSRQAGASLVSVALSETSEDVVLRISDDGPGVPAADRDRLFEPFFTSRRATGGTGLGLSIARSLLAASQGEIRLVGSDSGAAFAVTLPRAPSA